MEEQQIKDMQFIQKDAKAEELILELLELGYCPQEVEAFMTYLDFRESGELG